MNSLRNRLNSRDILVAPGAADALSRTTAIIATLFIITSISLTIISLNSNDRSLSFDEETIELPGEIEDLPELPQLD